MTQKAKIQGDLREAFKRRDAVKTSTLKMLLASINNAEIQLRKKEAGLSDEEEQKAIKSEAKKRTDAVEAYTSAGRPELAQKEKEEMEIIKSYLPEELSDEELTETVKEAVAKIGAGSIKELGTVMKKVMAITKGRADGKKASEIAKGLLG